MCYLDQSQTKTKYGGVKVCPNDEKHQLWVCGGAKKHVFCAKCQVLGGSKKNPGHVVKVVESVTTKKVVTTIVKQTPKKKAAAETKPSKKQTSIAKTATKAKATANQAVSLNFNLVAPNAFPIQNNSTIQQYLAPASQNYSAVQQYWANPNPTNPQRRLL